MAVNHQHLRAFHVIATEGSISRAARRLNVTQPTLSQQLRTLEERHQASLFDGRKPPLRLTNVGRQLFELTQKLFVTSQDIENLLHGPVGGMSNDLRLGSDSPFYAVRLAAAVRQRNPSVNTRVRIGNAPETFACLKDGKIDAAIVSEPPGDNALAYEPLFSDRLVAAVSVSSSFADLAEFPLAALGEERLLLRESGSRTRMAVEAMLAASNILPAEIMELHTRETIREGVALGLGIGFFLSRECPPDARIRTLPPDADIEISRMTGYLVCLVERRRTPLMLSVIDAAAELRAMSPLPVQPISALSTPRRSSKTAEPVQLAS